MSSQARGLANQEQELIAEVSPARLMATIRRGKLAGMTSHTKGL